MTRSRILALALAAGALPLCSQIEQATIVGTVTDNSGAVVSGAANSGQSRQVWSGARGAFGQVTSAGTGRVMQFGLRYEF